MLVLTDHSEVARRHHETAGRLESWAEAHCPFKDDKPLSTRATRTNTRTNKLSEGQMTLVKALKGYRMDVYPARRSCGFPDFVSLSMSGRKPTPARRNWPPTNGVWERRSVRQ